MGVRSGKALLEHLSPFYCCDPSQPLSALRLECSVAAPCRRSVLLAPPRPPACLASRPLLLRKRLWSPLLSSRRLNRHRAVLMALDVAALLVSSLTSCWFPSRPPEPSLSGSGRESPGGRGLSANYIRVSSWEEGAVSRATRPRTPPSPAEPLVSLAPTVSYWAGPGCTQQTSGAGRKTPVPFAPGPPHLPASPWRAA